MRRIEHTIKDGVEVKKCTKCKQFVLINNFCKGDLTDGLASSCKDCHNKQFPPNKEYCKKYYQEHKKERFVECLICKKKFKAHREKNFCSKECRSEAIRSRKYSRVAYQKCEDKTKYQIRGLEYRLKNKDKIKELERIYAKTEKGKLVRSMAKKLHKYKAKGLTREVIKKVVENNIFTFKELTCTYCNKKCLNVWHLEHKNPLARGGDNSLDNLTISCPTCNLSKGKKTVEEFNKYRELFTNIKLTNGVII